MSSLAHRLSRIAISVLLFFLPLVAVAWSYAPQGSVVAVSGQVSNGTPGGMVPAGLPVTLQVFSEAGTVAEYTTALGADGAFHFDSLPLTAGETAIARVVYQDVAYVSAPLTIEAGQGEISLPVTVYETTEDPAAVQITQLHVFMVGAGDVLQVGELYLISNLGDRTYIGALDEESGRRITLRFSAPEQAGELSLDEASPGERFVERTTGFADTAPIPPGTATVEVLISYLLPYQEGLQVVRTFDAPVASVVLVVSDAEMGLEGAQLTPGGTLETQMGPALGYTAGPLGAGEPLTFTLTRQTTAMSGEMTGTTSAPMRNAGSELLIGLLVLAAALVAVYMLFLSPAGAPPEGVRPLVQAIARLDADFEAGRIAENAYRQQREALERQVRQRLTGL